MSVNQKILDAIDLLVSKSIEQAQYDRTIQAQIISCEDPAIGKYKCRYQDSIFYAYSNNIQTSFSKNASVYVLVPNNDMNKNKTILGTVENSGLDYTTQDTNNEQQYDVVGKNCITFSQTYYLNSNNKNYSYKIYAYEQENLEDQYIQNYFPLIKDIELDINSLNKYIKNSSYLIAGATFRTNLPNHQQYRGHYGITYNLRFKDNTSNQQVIRSYTIDEDIMSGNPYKLLYDTRQYNIFKIDGPNFIRVQSIEIFNSGFPQANENVSGKKLSEGNIAINKLQLTGANEITQQEKNGMGISFYTPQGTFFINAEDPQAYKTITAQIRVKGKLLASNDASFYWGIQDAGISSNSLYYNNYLGRGWKCLNSSNVVDNTVTPPVVEWVAGEDTYIFNFKDATARENKIKVVAVLSEKSISKEIIIENYASLIPTLSIESSEGTAFYYDIGNPTLVCKVNGQDVPNDYIYSWGYESNEGVFTALPETYQNNLEYINLLSQLNLLERQIENGERFLNAEDSEINRLQLEIKKYELIQRVEKNKIYDVQIRDITNFGIFKCSVSTLDGEYLGTASILLTNSLQQQLNAYSLVINNGAVAFKYNENGIAPNNGSLDNQQNIQPLSFSIYDNLGNLIDNSIIENNENCSIKWAFPLEDTLLLDLGNESVVTSYTDENQGYKYYENINQLFFDIYPFYHLQKNNNQIKLFVNYKGTPLYAETRFVFIKEGESGTSGSEYFVKIVPNTQMINPPRWPIITKVDNTYKINYGINSSEIEQQIQVPLAYAFFRAQLWHNGEMVWQGYSLQQTAIDGITKPEKIVWDVLKNKYNGNYSDDSIFDVISENKNTGLITYMGENYLEYNPDKPSANIIKCSVTYNNKTFYGTLPVILTWVKNNNYRISLKESSGFRHVVYSSSGVLPEYDSSYPFEFTCLERIDDVWEDISLIEGDHSVSFSSFFSGAIKSVSDGNFINSNDLIPLNSTIYRKNLYKNQFLYKPTAKYNGECVTNAIGCQVLRGDQKIAKIIVPIHFLLNKYSVSQINDWDGNSVQINQQGEYILVPQVGAGKKNEKNQFTGLFMGEVKSPNKISGSDIGLFGYNEGERTLFLNSENGSALFGKAGKGQIAIDPTNDTAFIYSGNYWKEYGEDGLPINYNKSNKANEGLLINLTEGSIQGANFSISKNGVLTAEDDSYLGAWHIGEEKIHYDLTRAQAKAAAAGESIDSDDLHTVVMQKPSKNTTYVFAAGGISDSSYKDCPFRVSKKGYLYASRVYIEKPENFTGEIFITPSENGVGTLGTGARKWDTIYALNSSIASDKKIKNHLQYLDEDQQLCNFIYGLKPAMYTLKQGTGRRHHMGLYAQDVSQLAKQTMGDLAVYRAAVIGQNKDLIDGYFNSAIDDNKLAWSLNYSEFIAPIIAVLQKQKKQIEELKHQIKKINNY